MDLSSGSAGVLALWAAIGYGLGSIPFGLILAKAMNLGDLRKIGSGNIGATNVLRTGNKRAAVLTLLLDGGKGAVAVLIAHAYSGDSAAQIAALAAFLGHCYPVWLGFKGGKGVATFLGLLLALHWPLGLAACGPSASCSGSAGRWSRQRRLSSCLESSGPAFAKGQAARAWCSLMNAASPISARSPAASFRQRKSPASPSVRPLKAEMNGVSQRAAASGFTFR